jgi:hypothetical protein
MKNHKTLSLSLRLLCVTLIYAASSFAQTAPDAVLQKQYTDAVVDAKKAEPKEIVNTLTQIASCNNNLVREKIDPKTKKPDPNSRVLVTTWVSQAVATNYECKDCLEVEIPAGVYPFVTVVPEVKNFCADTGIAHAGLRLRLEQLLGLPPEFMVSPDKVKAKFVQLWVDPDDLFRPCPDPEITDAKCGLDFPTGFMTVSLNYVDWFDKLSCQSYPAFPNDYSGTALPGYPWTRLGYTYDWGLLNGHVGKSEFVIKAGSKVGVCSVTPTAFTPGCSRATSACRSQPCMTWTRRALKLWRERREQPLPRARAKFCKLAMPSISRRRIRSTRSLLREPRSPVFTSFVKSRWRPQRTTRVRCSKRRKRAREFFRLGTIAASLPFMQSSNKS